MREMSVRVRRGMQGEDSWGRGTTNDDKRKKRSDKITKKSLIFKLKTCILTRLGVEAGFISKICAYHLLQPTCMQKCGISGNSLPCLENDSLGPFDGLIRP